jgi:hypothetical protein
LENRSKVRFSDKSKEAVPKTEVLEQLHIKKLIQLAEDEEPETIHEIVHKIGMIFLKNVDKNVQKRC